MEAHPEYYQGFVEDDKSWRSYIEEMRLNGKFFAFLPSFLHQEGLPFSSTSVSPNGLWRLFIVIIFFGAPTRAGTKIQEHTVVISSCALSLT